MSRISEYHDRAEQELERCLRGKSAWNRQRDLRRAAERFRGLKGWRGQIPVAAGPWAIALEKLAADQKAGRRPGRPSGTTKRPERLYIKRAYARLIATAYRFERPDWAAELFVGGGGNRPSQGRALVAAYARSLALQDRVTLDSKKLTEQIRKGARFWSNGLI